MSLLAFAIWEAWVTFPRLSSLPMFYSFALPFFRLLSLSSPLFLPLCLNVLFFLLLCLLVLLALCLFSVSCFLHCSSSLFSLFFCVVLHFALGFLLLLFLSNWYSFLTLDVLSRHASCTYSYFLFFLLFSFLLNSAGNPLTLLSLLPLSWLCISFSSFSSFLFSLFFPLSFASYSSLLSPHFSCLLSFLSPYCLSAYIFLFVTSHHT